MTATISPSEWEDWRDLFQQKLGATEVPYADAAKDGSTSIMAPSHRAAKGVTKLRRYGRKVGDNQLCLDFGGDV